MTTKNFIDDIVRKDEQADRSLFQHQPPAEKLPDDEFWRRLRRCIPPAVASQIQIELDDAREIITDTINDYRILADPDFVLLIKALPGIGKTFYAVHTAEEEAMMGKNVAYAGPRHDFFNDVLEIADHPELWYEWQPRQAGDENGNGQTCRYTNEISAWLAKGYDAMTFCSGICGWDYVNSGCPYYAQKRERKDHPITFIQHSHVCLGHPLKFDVLIGDEDPTTSFTHRWTIPLKWIIPPGLMPNNPLSNLLSILRGVSASSDVIEGHALIDSLGGAENVLEVFEKSIMPWDAIASTNIHSLEEAETAGYFHLPKLSHLLQHEARLALIGGDYVGRIIAGGESLSLLLHHGVSESMPAHRVWLDATGNERIYRATFGQPVKTVDLSPKLQGSITVITDRANGKRALENRSKPEESIRNLEKVNRIINRIADEENAQRIGIVTFQGLIDGEDKLLLQDENRNREVLNFYGARGTNRLKDVDTLFVIGTPMPEQSIFRSMAAMIFSKRDRPFDDRWTWRYLPYNFIDENKDGWEYPAGGFWNDQDLQALLYQWREAEIIQAVHRARPLLHSVNVYLLTNLPIIELRVDRLLSISELFDVPDGIDRYKWAKFVEFASEQSVIDTADVVALFGNMKAETARKYITKLVETLPGWELMASRTGGRGKPRLGAQNVKDL